jgi:predicted nucleotide-binding protein (sugar kinase/HSP70/actin superfamily)
MTIYAENNKKTEAIKESLSELLIKLESRKKIVSDRKPYLHFETRIPLYIPTENLDLLIKATSTLSNLIKQFKSIDDFNSVKKLRETELLFKNDELKDFVFLNYKSQIDPNLLDRVNIEIGLDKISRKAKNLEGRGYHSEGVIAKGIVIELKKLNCSYFEEKLIDLNDYKTRALAIIDDARPFLKQHRGFKRILTNLAALISTLGIAFVVNKCVNNHFLFFPETKSSALLIKVEHRVSQLNS